MNKWDQIAEEAEVIARQLRQDAVDLAEAEKAGDYFLTHDCNEDQIKRYLQLLAQNPPVRSKRSIHHYRNLNKIWGGWRTTLVGEDKARAWGWGVRLAKSGQ